MTAPTPGTDEEFERIVDSVNDALKDDPGAAGLSQGIRRQTLARVLAKYGGKDYDSIVLDEYPDVATIANEPRSIAIPALATEPYWYEPEADADFADHLIESRRQLGARVPGGFLVTGPAGSGKTRGVVMAVNRYNEKHGTSIPILVMNCPTITDPQKWFGRREVDKNGTRYVESDFVRVFREGGVIVLDEFMRLHPTLHNPVMSGLDGTEAITLSDMNLRIERHPQTVIFGTTNQGAQFGGTHRMDWAMRERWSFTIERTFPPVEEEIKVLTSHNPGCDPDAAEVLVTVAERTRRMWETGDLRSPISTRTLDNAAFLVASGYTEREALERTALPEYDDAATGAAGKESERAQVRAIIEGKRG